MLTGDDLTVQTFIAATAITLLGIAVTQAGWTHKQFVRSLFILGGLLAAIALFWSPIIRFWPAASNLSIGPWAWLLLVTLAVGAISWLEIAAREKRRASVPLNDLRREIDRLAAQVSKVAQGQGEANSGLSGMIGRVEDKADKIALNVQADVRELRASIASLGQQVESNHALTGNGQLRLAQSLKARDSLEIIRSADREICDLAQRLQEATPADYPEHRSWLSDYRKWCDVLGRVDAVFAHWEKNHQAFLNVTRADYERVRDMPPQHISPEVATQFKTLCIANERYQSSREGILNFFVLKAADI